MVDVGPGEVLDRGLEGGKSDDDLRVAISNVFRLIHTGHGGCNHLNASRQLLESVENATVDLHVLCTAMGAEGSMSGSLVVVGRHC